MKNSIPFLLVFTFLVYGCSSSDDSSGSSTDLNSLDWNVEIQHLTATTLTFEKGGVISSNDIQLGYRKKGEEIFKPLSGHENEITSLVPLTEYEMALFNPKTNEASLEKVTFTTLPFDIVDYNEESTNSSDLLTVYLSSFEGNTHKFSLRNVPEALNNITGKLIGWESEDEKMVIENIEIKDDTLFFTVPRGILSIEPYVPRKEYRLEYTIDGYKYLLNDANYSQGARQVDFVVYNENPYIENIEISEDAWCNGASAFTVRVNGYFMPILPGQKETVDSNDVVGIITRLDDSSTIIIESNKDHNDDCAYFNRVWSTDNKDEFGHIPYHFSRQIWFERVKSELGLYPGEYKIRFTFDKGDEFYETNEFPFTITE